MQGIKNRFRGAKAVIVLALCALLAWPWLQTDEPVYHDLSLRLWLARYDELFKPLDDELPRGEAYTAIREIGTNGIPILLRLVDSKTLSIKWQLEKQLGVHLHRGRNPEFRNQRLAWSGFAALGSTAEPAVPRLIELLNNRKPSVRAAAAISLGYIGPVADDAVFPLLAQITNAEYRVRSSAVWALGQIRGKPECVLPIFLDVLNKSDHTDPLMCDTLSALSKYGADAKMAIPTLRVLSESPNYSTRWWALEALRRIGASSNTVVSEIRNNLSAAMRSAADLTPSL